MRFYPRTLWHLNNRITFLLLLSFILSFIFSCQAPVYVSRESYIPPVKKSEAVPDSATVTETVVPPMEHAIQAGAFSSLENAVRFTDSLQKLGLDPYYFKDAGLYKVRFGDFESRDQAIARANELRESGMIEAYYIIGPADYHRGKDNTRDMATDLRSEIVRTARSFIGIPYRFGGENAEQGFDCSGLTMASYRLNGIKLPRNSRQQWAAGKSIDKRDAREGDLVFFDTLGKGRVSHVGIYIGNGQFIHAPRTGKTIRIASMSSSYFKNCYLGTKTYL